MAFNGSPRCNAIAPSAWGTGLDVLVGGEEAETHNRPDPDPAGLGRLDHALSMLDAMAGDPLAARAVERENFYLGIGLANLVNLFVPDAIILGGSVMKSAGAFLDDIRRVMQQGCRFVPLDKVELALASLGDDANLIGAARVWHHRFAG